MIQMLRKEACSGAMEDLAHVRTEFCLADSLTKHTAKPDVLIAAVESGTLREVDHEPPFRSQLQHKAFVAVLDNVGFDWNALRAACPNNHVDTWELHDHELVRVHRVPRKKHFSPHEVTDLPVSISKISPVRTAYMSTSTGQSVKTSSWLQQVSEQHLWTGSTHFPLSSF